MGNKRSQHSKRSNEAGNTDGEDYQVSILMVGLDNAGKTTILHRLKWNETVVTTPTICFSIEFVSPRKGVTFALYDMGGQRRIRALWPCHIFEPRGIIYVVDCSDLDRIAEAKQELFNILENPRLKGLPLLVIANKQDVRGALEPYKLAKKLTLFQHKANDWSVHGACATTGQGLHKAMRKLSDMVKEHDRTRAKNSN